MRSPEEIVYEESIRALDSQLRALEQLWNRASIILAANGLTASFFADVASSDGIGAFGGIALVGVAGSAAFAIAILLPRRKAWTFVSSAAILIEDHLNVPGRNSSEQLLLYRALEAERHWDRNEARLERLYTYLWLSCIAFGVDIVLWLLEIGVP